MKAHRIIISTTTVMAMTASLLAAPATAATAAGKDTTSKPEINIELIRLDAEPTCVFNAVKPPLEDLVLTAQRYAAVRDSLRAKIRKDMPADAALFARADTLTGTTATPKPGSLDNPELTQIVTTVRTHMIAAGFAADGSETDLAFYHVPPAFATAPVLSEDALTLLPRMNVFQATAALGRPTSAEDSLAHRADAVMRSATAVRRWLDSLTNHGSIAVLNRLDDTEVNKLQASLKMITASTPASLEAASRYWIRKCISRIRTTSLTDGTASSRLSSERPGGGSSDESNPAEESGLSTASTDLSSGRGLSSAADISSIITHGSSDADGDTTGEGWQKKLAALILIVGGITTIITALVRFGSLFRSIAAIVTEQANSPNPA